jgi:amino acid adenylation domain-containing protein
VSVTPNDLSQLTPEQRRDLLTSLLAKREAAEGTVASCSYGQRSLWFMHQLTPLSSVYNVSVAWRIRSALDVGAMHRAFRALVDRHESLRTTYEHRDGEPWQRVRSSVPDGFRVRAVGACADDALMQLLVDDAKQPFDLERGPLLRATLATRHDEDHVLLVVIHHVACDLWSVEHMLEDLRVLYEREAFPDRSVSLAPMPGSYRDFVSWQRAMLASSEGEAHWNYWREKLGGPIPHLELPTDRPRPAVQSFVGDGVLFPLPADLVADLRAYAAAQGTTLFTLLLAAYQSLLARYSGQTDILVGSVSSGRSRREFEATVGYFVNPITFRCDTSDDPTFQELLQRTRKDVLDALDHQDFPFPLLVERLKIDRDPSRSPLSDAYFVWDKARDKGGNIVTERTDEKTQVQIEWQDVSLEQFALTQIGTPSDIAMAVFEVGPTISVNVGYSTDLFDRPTIERFGEHYIALLRAGVTDDNIRISRIPLTTDAERRALLDVHPERGYPVHAGDSLSRRFEAQALRRPDAVAVTGASGQLTYRELDERANVVAARLLAAGVEAGGLVGLYLERDLAMIVAVLGILKAGAAYLPIDRSYPDDRAAFMLQDAAATVMLTERALADALPSVDVRRVYVDDPTSADELSATVDVAVGPHDRAYVIYTSGSTGRPKGVMVTHRNVMRLFDATMDWYAFTQDDVWSLFHSIGFDFSVWEVWGALLHGGRLVVVPYAVTRSPDAMLELLKTEGVTILSQTPSAFRQIVAVDAGRPTVDPLSLRLVVFGGEALDVNWLRPWMERRGDAEPRLVNMYGITETTVHTTYRPVSAADLDRRVRSPIGIPIPDLHLLVLDPAGEPVPVGVPGELYVGGAGVARGYLNRPELTAARFLPDPTSSDSRARVYRSGDLARRLANGDIEYLGRIDHQVKVRGFRIELGEIEAALARHEAVDHCAALIRPDQGGEPRIIAYVVARAGQDPSSSELQAFVRRSLPEYMVPSAFVRLAELPLTSNHKLDVKSLPVPDQVESSSSRTFVEPRTDTERAIAAEWKRILRVERVGSDDDFFELGGHSILATGIARWIKQHFSVDFPVYAVFESPSVAEMARRVDELLAERNTEPREEFAL